MPMHMYVSCQIDDKIAHFTIDDRTGKLTNNGDIKAPGGPAPMALRPDQKAIYVGYRAEGEVLHQGKDGAEKDEFGLSAFAIDQKTGDLAPLGKKVHTKGEPCCVDTDSQGKWLAASYMQLGHVGIWPINGDGSVGEKSTAWLETNSGAHSVQIDPSDRYVFVPHIAQANAGLKRLPLDRRLAANAIFQFKFDKTKGTLTPNDPPKVGPARDLGPRHFAFHPTKPFLYTCDEQGCTVTAWAFDKDKGTLTYVECVTTIPLEGFQLRSSTADIHVHPNGKWVYATNRGYNSIVRYAVKDDGKLDTLGWTKVRAVPRAVRIDPTGNFFYVGNLREATMSGYRIDQSTGDLAEIETVPVGNMPMWVLITNIPG